MRTVGRITVMAAAALITLVASQAAASAATAVEYAVMLAM